MGLFPIQAAEGDKICVFKGCKASAVRIRSGHEYHLFQSCEASFVIRQNEDSCLLVGDAYIHGFVPEDAMDREGIHFEGILLG